MRYFPLFADLHGRRVLVVGGGVVAERKARLLLQAGARVAVVAPQLTGWLSERAGSPEPGASPTLAGEAGPAPGADTMTWVADRFDESCLDGAILVVAATDDDGVNARVAAAARARNVLVNVVDSAEESSFIVPAVVDRSPLVIAISSGGVAPVLARHLRERIESIVDESFGALATLLARWRQRIKAALPVVADRRRFYERVLRGPVAARLRSRQPGQAEAELARELRQGEERPRGSVALVGAGPGDPGLLTLNALRALQQADVILHDRLVSGEVLGLARRDAELLCVGKAAGEHSVAQERIHELLVEHARAGRQVVRLKGGDPFIFGRGGEELEFLRRHGIPYEVVPGITAAVACGAYAGIPLTHRHHAQSVRLVTAHCSESIDALDWAALAQERQTVALYMGVAGLGTIRARLLAHGRAPRTPVAIVESASRPEQRVTLTSLDELGAGAGSGDIRSPALVIVGEVAALAGQLHWFGAPPRTASALKLAAA